MKESKNIIGRVIKYWRNEIGITQQELAGRLEIDRQYIWRLENGKINMSLDYVDKVIDKLGCTREDFYNAIKIIQ
jgi:transcriptional regulator with XRE-family HTH domain